MFKNKLIATLGVLLCLGSMAVCQPDSLDDDHKRQMLESLAIRIYGFKAGLCPDITENINPGTDGLKGYDILYPELYTETFRFRYRYQFEIQPYPHPQTGASPFVNFYMIVKKSNTLYHTYMSFSEIGLEKHLKVNRDEHGNPIMVTDSFDLHHPCYDYFPYDERYLVHYDPETWRLLVFSGNVYQDKLSFRREYESFFRLGSTYAHRAALLRCSQYFTPKTVLEYGPETDTSYVFYATYTQLLPQNPLHKLKIRMHKTNKFFTFGDSWEMIYYSNSRDIPGNEKRQFYEVKYTRSFEPESYHELYPTYRWIDKDEVLEIRSTQNFLFVYDEHPVLMDILYSDDWEKAYDYNIYEEEEEEED